MADTVYKNFWNETLIQLRAELGEEEFHGWFTELHFLRAGENSICIGVPSTFFRDKVKARYQNSIIAKLKDLAGRDIALEFEVMANGKAPSETESEQKSAGTGINQDQNAIIDPSNAVSAAITAPPKPKKGKHPQLRDDFTFERYIIGEPNSFPANVAIAISRNPGHAYNPFFIYGGVGLGKTHLMQAIGNYLHENTDNKVIYITGEDFLNEYIQHINEKKMSTFKNKFRYTDVLLMDDIQFFQGKGETVKEELFHTFNALLNTKKQMVFTCDRPPSELKNISDRLLSRFESGTKVDIQPPPYEVRCAILKSTAENRNAAVSDEVIDLISKNISSNIRELIGALNTLISYTELMGKPITLEVAQQKLRDAFTSRYEANLSIENIIQAVAEYFKLTRNDLKGKKRNQSIVFPRQLAMYIAREITDFSTTEIGEEFNRDHATVMHSIAKIEAQLLTNPALDSTIESLKRLIKENSAKT